MDNPRDKKTRRLMRLKLKHHSWARFDGFTGLVIATCALFLAACEEQGTVIGEIPDAVVTETDASVDDAQPIVDMAGSDLDAAIGDPVRGAPLYEQYCGFCHGYEGEGYLADSANALSNQAFLATATDDFIRTAIVEGRPGTPMSPWGIGNAGPLDDQAVADVTAYVRQWQTEPTEDVHGITVEGTPMRGRSAYGAFCKSCHGDEGEGASFMSLNNPWFLETASDGFIRHAIAKGRPGTAMPGYEERVSPQTIDDLVVLIRSWATPVSGEIPEPFEPDLTKAVINEGGEAASFELREGRFAAAADVHAAIENGQSLVLIDARPTADYLQSHLAGALSIPFYDIETYIDQLPRDFFVITYCGCPHAVSGQAADALLAAGFQNVAVLDEGYYFWADQGWPLENGAPE